MIQLNVYDLTRAASRSNMIIFMNLHSPAIESKTSSHPESSTSTTRPLLGAVTLFAHGLSTMCHGLIPSAIVITSSSTPTEVSGDTNRLAPLLLQPLSTNGSYMNLRSHAPLLHLSMPSSLPFMLHLIGSPPLNNRPLTSIS